LGATDSVFVDGTTPDLVAADLNGFNLEQKNLIEDAELVFDDTDREQQSKAVSNLVAKGNFRGDSGAADAYVLEPTGNQKRATALMNGQTFIFQVGNTNTGASTVAVDGLTAKAIVDQDGNALSAGDITQYDYVKIGYDSSNDRFILLANFTLFATIIDQSKNNLAVTKSTNYVITDTDRVRTVLIDTAGVAITLPDASNNTNRPITIIKNVSTNTASQITGTINGVSNPSLDFYHEAVTIVSDGTSWILMNHYIPNPQYTLTVTGTNSWVTTKAIGEVTKTLSGNWYIWQMIVGTHSNSSTQTITTSGIIYKNIATYYQPINCWYGGGKGNSAYCNPNTDDILAEAEVAATSTWISGKAELEEKPTFVL
jgi:hypothetical protein